jgi:hypothetical protein
MLLEEFSVLFPHFYRGYWCRLIPGAEGPHEIILLGLLGNAFLFALLSARLC